MCGENQNPPRTDIHRERIRQGLKFPTVSLYLWRHCRVVFERPGCVSTKKIGAWCPSQPCWPRPATPTCLATATATASSPDCLASLPSMSDRPGPVRPVLSPALPILSPHQVKKRRHQCFPSCRGAAGCGCRGKQFPWDGEPGALSAHKNILDQEAN